MYLKFEPPLPVENFHALLDQRVMKAVRRKIRLRPKLTKLIREAMRKANDKGYSGMQDTRFVAEDRLWWVSTSGSYVGGIGIEIHRKVL